MDLDDRGGDAAAEGGAGGEPLALRLDSEVEAVAVDVTAVAQAHLQLGGVVPGHLDHVDDGTGLEGGESGGAVVLGLDQGWHVDSDGSGAGWRERSRKDGRLRGGGGRCWRAGNREGDRGGRQRHVSRRCGRGSWRRRGRCGDRGRVYDRGSGAALVVDPHRDARGVEGGRYRLDLSRAVQLDLGDAVAPEALCVALGIGCIADQQDVPMTRSEQPCQPGHAVGDDEVAVGGGECRREYPLRLRAQ